MPTLYLIAGPNGAGKTTFASRFLPEESGELEFVNVDLIARGLSPFAPDAAAGAAGRIALTRVGRLIKERKTFAWETTLSGRTTKSWVLKARAAGYFIKLVFIWIQSLEESIDRIQRRVREGGHDVPVRDVRRRFLKTLANFFHDYCPLATMHESEKVGTPRCGVRSAPRADHANSFASVTDALPLADAWKLFDNSNESLRLVAVHKNGRTVIRDRSLWSSVISQGGVVL